MHNAGPMRRIKGVRHLDRVSQHQRQRQAALGDQLTESLSVYQFHHHELGFALRDDVVNGDDVGVVQRGCSLRFLQEPPPLFARPGVLRGEHLDGYPPVQPHIQGPIDFAHAAGAQPLRDLIMRNRAANHASPSETIQFATTGLPLAMRQPASVAGRSAAAPGTHGNRERQECAARPC